MAEHPSYEVTNYQQEKAWRKWSYDATDAQLLVALRGAGHSMESVPARECCDELQNRGYTIIGVYPHEITLEKPEGQPVDWSEVFDNDEDDE